MYTEEIGGILTLEFDEDGNLEFKTEALDADAMLMRLAAYCASNRSEKKTGVAGISGDVLPGILSWGRDGRRGRKDETSDWKCNITEPSGSGSDGRGVYRPAISSPIAKNRVRTLCMEWSVPRPFIIRIRIHRN